MKTHKGDRWQAVPGVFCGEGNLTKARCGVIIPRAQIRVRRAAISCRHQACYGRRQYWKPR